MFSLSTCHSRTGLRNTAFVCALVLFMPNWSLTRPRLTAPLMCMYPFTIYFLVYYITLNIVWSMLQCTFKHAWTLYKCGPQILSKAISFCQAVQSGCYKTRHVKIYKSTPLSCKTPQYSWFTAAAYRLFLGSIANVHFTLCNKVNHTRCYSTANRYRPPNFKFDN